MNENLLMKYLGVYGLLGVVAVAVIVPTYIIYTNFNGNQSTNEIIKNIKQEKHLEPKSETAVAPKTAAVPKTLAVPKSESKSSSENGSKIKSQSELKAKVDKNGQSLLDRYIIGKLPKTKVKLKIKNKNKISDIFFELGDFKKKLKTADNL